MSFQKTVLAGAGFRSKGCWNRTQTSQNRHSLPDVSQFAAAQLRALCRGPGRLHTCTIGVGLWWRGALGSTRHASVAGFWDRRHFGTTRREPGIWRVRMPGAWHVLSSRRGVSMQESSEFTGEIESTERV